MTPLAANKAFVKLVRQMTMLQRECQRYQRHKTSQKSAASMTPILRELQWAIRQYIENMANTLNSAITGEEVWSSLDRVNAFRAVVNAFIVELNETKGTLYGIAMQKILIKSSNGTLTKFADLNNLTFEQRMAYNMLVKASKHLKKDLLIFSGWLMYNAASKPTLEVQHDQTYLRHHCSNVVSVCCCTTLNTK